MQVLKDIQCPQRSETSDRCACQLKATARRLDYIHKLCQNIAECDTVVFNPTRTWATLKQRLHVSGLNTTLPKREKLEWTSTVTRMKGKMCGSLRHVARIQLGILAMTYKTPLSLEHSMRSWYSSGLLTICFERMLIASRATELEYRLANMYNFSLVEPRHTRMKVTRSNVATIGVSFAYGMTHMKSRFVLVLEKDFALAPTFSRHIQDELVGAMTQLVRGALVVYLRSRMDQGCGSFQGCEISPVHTRGSMWLRKDNWWKFYCNGTHDYGRSSACLQSQNVLFKCYTSEDANWSLNAAMVLRKRILRHKVGNGMTLHQMAQLEWNHQHGFENYMMQNDWGRWKVPLCLSYYGLFTHSEIDG